MGAIDRVFRSRRPSQERPAAATVAGLWKNGEQGVWYDVESFRDSLSQVGPNLTPPTAAVFGEASVVSPGVYRIYSSSGAFSSVNSAAAVIGRRYVVSFNVDSITTLGSGLVIESAENPSITTIGPKSFLVTAVNTSLHIKRGAACDIQISGVSAKEWLGRDSCTLYQDASGALPAYMPGQGQVDSPVGLLLDKRRGLVRGPEQFLNADFSSGATNWNVSGEDATHIATFSSGTLRYQSDTTSPVLTISQGALSITAGRWYEVSVVVSSWVSGSIKTDTLNGNASAGLMLANGVGTFKVVGLATSTTTVFSFLRNSINVDLTIDSISIRELQGNHAYQTTTTSRPTLSARYNWATFTEDLTASVWQKGTPAFTITPKATLAPDGVSLADIVVSPDSGTPILSHVLTAQAPSAALSFFIKPIANASALSLLFRNNTTATNYDGTTLNTVNGTAGVPAWVVTPAGNGWLKISYARATGITAGDQISIYAGATGAIAVPGRMWSVWGLDVRSGNDGVGLPPYQRVKDSNTYDTIGFPLYLRFDGVDDFLQTASIDFSAASSITAFAAVRKLSDATRGIIFELGTQGYGQPGSFNFEQAWFSPNFSASHSGASGSATTTKAGIGAPASAVLSAVFDQSAPAVRLRYQGQDASQNAGVVGGGGYLNAAIYIGRRAGTSSPASMRLYGAAIRTGVLGGMQIAAVEKLLNQKARIY